MFIHFTSLLVKNGGFVLLAKAFWVYSLKTSLFPFNKTFDGFQQDII